MAGVDASVIRLRGMTWDHARAYEPVVAAAEAYSATHPEVAIAWDRRSLQAFESQPLDQIAEAYDFIVIDHPHLGAVARSGCLRPFEQAGRDEELDALAEASVGLSFDSYRYEDRLWALPVDAAAMVQAWRPDARDEPIASWTEVIEEARRGRVVWPLRTPHSACSFFSLAANLGHPCRTEEGDFVDEAPGVAVLEAMRAVAVHIDPVCFQMDAIAALDALGTELGLVFAPLVFGYVNYARDGFRSRAVRFADMPAMGTEGPRGSTLGGTGFAVTTGCQYPAAAFDFGLFLAGAACQAGVYAAAGGQPAHHAAWESDQVNAANGDFYRATLRTLEAAWLRPRHDGFIGFQQDAGEIVNACLKAEIDAPTAVRRLNQRFRASFG